MLRCYACKVYKAKEAKLVLQIRQINIKIYLDSDIMHCNIMTSTPSVLNISYYPLIHKLNITLPQHKHYFKFITRNREVASIELPWFGKHSQTQACGSSVRLVIPLLGSKAVFFVTGRQTFVRHYCDRLMPLYLY